MRSIQSTWNWYNTVSTGNLIKTNINTDSLLVSDTLVTPQVDALVHGPLILCYNCYKLQTIHLQRDLSSFILVAFFPHHTWVSKAKNHGFFLAITAHFRRKRHSGEFTRSHISHELPKHPQHIWCPIKNTKSGFQLDDYDDVTCITPIYWEQYASSHTNQSFLSFHKHICTYLSRLPIRTRLV